MQLACFGPSILQSYPHVPTDRTSSNSLLSTKIVVSTLRCLCTVSVCGLASSYYPIALLRKRIMSQLHFSTRILYMTCEKASSVHEVESGDTASDNAVKGTKESLRVNYVCTVESSPLDHMVSRRGSKLQDLATYWISFIPCLRADGWAPYALTSPLARTLFTINLDSQPTRPQQVIGCCATVACFTPYRCIRP